MIISLFILPSTLHAAKFLTPDRPVLAKDAMKAVPQGDALQKAIALSLSYKEGEDSDTVDPVSMFGYLSGMISELFGGQDIRKLLSDAIMGDLNPQYCGDGCPYDDDCGCGPEPGPHKHCPLFEQDLGFLGYLALSVEDTNCDGWAVYYDPFTTNPYIDDYPSDPYPWVELKPNPAKNAIDLSLEIYDFAIEMFMCPVATCTINYITVDKFRIDATLNIVIDESIMVEIEMEDAQATLGNVEVDTSGICGFLEWLIDIIIDMLKSQIEDYLTELLVDQIEDLLAGLFPMDLHPLLTGNPQICEPGYNHAGFLYGAMQMGDGYFDIGLYPSIQATPRGLNLYIDFAMKPRSWYQWKSCVDLTKAQAPETSCVRLNPTDPVLTCPDPPDYTRVGLDGITPVDPDGNPYMIAIGLSQDVKTTLFYFLITSGLLCLDFDLDIDMMGILSPILKSYADPGSDATLKITPRGTPQAKLGFYPGAPFTPVPTVLTADIGAGDVTLPVLSNREYPRRGYVKIDDEVIKYDNTNATPTQFLAVERGAMGTTAAAHSANTPLLKMYDCMLEIPNLDLDFWMMVDNVPRRAFAVRKKIWIAANIEYLFDQEICDAFDPNNIPGGGEDWYDDDPDNEVIDINDKCFEVFLEVKCEVTDVLYSMDLPPSGSDYPFTKDMLKNQIARVLESVLGMWIKDKVLHTNLAIMGINIEFGYVGPEPGSGDFDGNGVGDYLSLYKNLVGDLDFEAIFGMGLTDDISNPITPGATCEGGGFGGGGDGDDEEGTGYKGYCKAPARRKPAGFRVQGSGDKSQGSGFRGQGSGFRGQGSVRRTQGKGTVPDLRRSAASRRIGTVPGLEGLPDTFITLTDELPARPAGGPTPNSQLPTPSSQLRTINDRIYITEQGVEVLISGTREVQGSKLKAQSSKLEAQSSKLQATSSKPNSELDFSFSLDRGYWHIPTPNERITLPYLLEGEHILRVKAITPDGLVDPTPAELVFTFDSQPPEITLEVEGEQWEESSGIRAQGSKLKAQGTRPTAHGSRLNVYQIDGDELVFTVDTWDFITQVDPIRLSYGLDGGEMRPLKVLSTVELAGLEEGVHRLEVSAGDEAGNIKTVAYMFEVRTGDDIKESGGGCAQSRGPKEGPTNPLIPIITILLLLAILSFLRAIRPRLRGSGS